MCEVPLASSCFPIGLGSVVLLHLSMFFISLVLFRRSLTEVADQGHLDEGKRLIVDGHEVGAQNLASKKTLGCFHESNTEF